MARRKSVKARIVALPPRTLVWNEAVWDHLGGWKERRFGPEWVSDGRWWSYMLKPIGRRWVVEFTRTDEHKQTHSYSLTKSMTFFAAKQAAQHIEETR